MPIGTDEQGRSYVDLPGGARIYFDDSRSPIEGKFFRQDGTPVKGGATRPQPTPTATFTSEQQQLINTGGVILILILLFAFLKKALQNLRLGPQQAPTLQSYQAFSKAGDRARGVLKRFLNGAIGIDCINDVDKSKERDNHSPGEAKAANSNPSHSKLMKIFASLFEISGYFAKVDGRVSREEIKSITNLMNEMQFGIEQRQQAEDLFRRGKQTSEVNMLNLVNELKDQYYNTPEILNILVMVLMQIAFSDENMTDSERKILEAIAMQLGLDQITLSIIELAVCCEFQNIKSLDLQDVYKIIGISDTASHHETKEAYRNLLKAYHPDSLQSKGLPKEMLVFGIRLSQIFNLAYDRIKAERKF